MKKKMTAMVAGIVFGICLFLFLLLFLDIVLSRWIAVGSSIIFAFALYFMSRKPLL